ncbi:quinone oxidoreductase family protein [Phenylobacterium immobile]|uniref:quinone oxidoreductase family protein n=1 Tax=Phenylobacterium immobile TaxID=21 RepID=UPI000A6817BC|nr:zinc-binding alcohol dehydrogenase family protein [Phenylobacterium immobile]
MKAAVYYEPGSPSVLSYEDVADPTPAAGEVLIRVQAISIEGGDVLRRSRMAPPHTPYVVGYQAGGEVAAVGPGVSEFKVGDRVVGFNINQGSHAELHVTPAAATYAVPDRLEMRKAAAMPVAFGTAHNCLFERGRLQTGETVLVQGGASGVGVAAIQLAKRAGARVLVTASSAEKLDRLHSLGVDEAINYAREDVVERVMALTNGRGVDVVLDPVGGKVLEGSMRVLAPGGRISWVGSAGREPVVLDLALLRGMNRSITAAFFEGMTPSGHAMVQRLIEEAARGELEVWIDKVFPLSEAAAAHTYIESRQAVGRVIMEP